jgi:hypothetical protein
VKLFSWAGLLSVGIFLGGCGGGSSSTQAIASTSTFPVDVAYKNNISTAQSRSIKVSSSSSTQSSSGTATMIESGLSATTFNGANVQVRTVSLNGTLTSGIQSTPFSVNETTYLDSNLLQVGSRTINSANVNTLAYQTAVVIAALPGTAKVGDSGTFLMVESFSDPAKTIRTSTNTLAWELSADTATTALLKLTTTITNSASNGSTVETLRVTPAGAATRLQLDGNINGVRVVYDF